MAPHHTVVFFFVRGLGGGPPPCRDRCPSNFFSAPLEGIQSAPADTRLGGHALENSLFREFNETYRLSAGNRGEILQELLNRRSAFPVVDQCLDGDPGS